jgi:hypothetical protein
MHPAIRAKHGGQAQQPSTATKHSSRSRQCYAIIRSLHIDDKRNIRSTSVQYKNLQPTFGESSGYLNDQESQNRFWD